MTNNQSLIESCEKNIIFYSGQLSELRKMFKEYDESVELEKEGSEMINLKRSMNYSGSLIISLLDLSVILHNLILAKTDWEKIYFIKNSFLIIHETFKLIKPKIGQSIIEENINTKAKILKNDLIKLNDKIISFKNNNYQQIENVRHYVAGHINPSFKKYYDTVSILDGDEAVKKINDFLKILKFAFLLNGNCEFEMKKNLKMKK